MTDNAPKLLARRRIFSGRVFKIDELDLQFANGAQATFECAVPRSSRAVLIIPLIDKDTVLLIREYAVAMGRYELGFAKGGMDDQEDYLTAANREMKEEVGYGANKFHLLKTVTSIPGYIVEQMYCVVAEDLYPERLTGDEPEPIEVVPWPIAKLDELLTRDDFSEGRSIAALYLLKQYLNSK